MRAAAVMAAVATACGCHGKGVLDPKGPVGKAELLLLMDATAIMLAVIIPVILLTLAFAWWFRAGNRKAIYLPEWQYSGRIEMIVWSIPLLIVVFLGGIAWVSAHNLDPAKKIDSSAMPLEVEVVSLDWKWLFIYPEQKIALVNRLVLPVGRPVHFRLTSATVMNSFFIPSLGSQIYTMPGMATQLNLQADHPGTYEGLSAQFSGDGFSDMRFDAEAMMPDRFEAWAASSQGMGGMLDEANYSQLAKPGKYPGTKIYGKVMPGLFESIAFPDLRPVAMTHPE